MTYELGAAAVASAIGGTGLLGYGLYLRSKLRSCQHWPQAAGKVIQSCLERDEGYQISLAYEYTVNGAGYSSSRIQFGTPTTYLRKSSAEAALSRYPVDSYLTVYYNPENPAESVLDRTSPGGLEYIICGIILLGMTALVVLYPAHSKSSSSAGLSTIGKHIVKTGRA